MGAAIVNFLRSPIVLPQFAVDFIIFAIAAGVVAFLFALIVPVSYAVAAISIAVIAVAGASWVKWGMKPAVAK